MLFRSHQVYLLYFALNGSGQDIGARFAGYDYKGFDNETSVMPGTILINMGEDKTVTDEMYDSLYNGGNAEAGVKALIAEGKVSINGFVIPKTEDEFKKEGFKVNEAEWIIPEENGTYKVDRTGGLNWQQAALAALMRVSNGNEVRLYDEDGNGKVDRIDALYAEAMIAEKIEQKTEEGTEGGKDKVTYTVTRADIEKSPAFEGKDGRPYDGEVSSLTADEAYFLSYASANPSSPLIAVSIFTPVCLRRLWKTVRFISVSSTTRICASGALNDSLYFACLSSEAL